MHVLVVTAHPRENSLTQSVAEKVCGGLVESGCTVELADLYAENFDPRLNTQDEPDWEDTEKEYSVEVKKEVARIERADAMIMVFPVWWWSMPAMLKGWIDRVWGYGFAYGEGNTLPVQKIVSIGVSANSESDESSQIFFESLKKQMVEGICHYCGVKDATFVLLGDSLGGEERAEEILKRAHQMGVQFKTN
jgi:NAD(P)H dehydrogenase (quinone)